MKRTLLALSFWVLFWELAVRASHLDFRFFPPPSIILGGLVELFSLPQGEIYAHIWASGKRFLVAALWATPLAFLFSGLVVFTKWGDFFLSPLQAVIFPIPKAAIYPLFLALFGIGQESQILIIALGFFFLLSFELQNSLQKIYKSKRFDIARVYQVPPLKRFYYFLFRPLLPDFFVGLKMAIGYGLVMVVVSETIIVREGIGAFIYRSWDRFEMVHLFAGLCVIGIIGWAANSFCEYFREKFSWPN